MARISVSASSRTATIMLSAAAIGVVGVSLALQLVAAAYGADHIFGLLPLFNIDREGNVPAWLSSAMLALAGLVAWGLAADNEGEAARRERFGWTVAACVLFYMSLDEGAQVHERVGDLAKPFVPDIGVFYFSWTAIAIVILLAAVPFALRFLALLRSQTRFGLIVAGIVFLSGALGVEMITGQYMHVAENKMSLPYFLLSHAEELLEMIGVVLTIRVLLRHKEARENDALRTAAAMESAALRHA